MYLIAKSYDMHGPLTCELDSVVTTKSFAKALGAIESMFGCGEGVMSIENHHGDMSLDVNGHADFIRDDLARVSEVTLWAINGNDDVVCRVSIREVSWTI